MICIGTFDLVARGIDIAKSKTETPLIIVEVVNYKEEEEFHREFFEPLLGKVLLYYCILSFNLFPTLVYDMPEKQSYYSPTCVRYVPLLPQSSRL